jgi:hypothetical protein
MKPTSTLYDSHNVIGRIIIPRGASCGHGAVVSSLSVFNSGRWGGVEVSMALVSHACVASHEWKSLVGIGRGKEEEGRTEGKESGRAR